MIGLKNFVPTISIGRELFLLLIFTPKSFKGFITLEKSLLDKLLSPVNFITNLDFKEKNIYGFEIFLKNIPESRKKQRIIKNNYVVSDFQKSERDFAFVIDKTFKVVEIEKIINEVDSSIIKNVSVFDIFEGKNLPEGKKSVAINVTIQAMDRTLSENDLNEVSKRIINKVKEKTGATIRS